MDFFNEFGLAIAVALPVLVIVGLNAFLAASGEAGTLLLPGLHSYPEIGVSRAQAAPVVEMEARVEAPAAAPANDMLERKAA